MTRQRKKSIHGGGSVYQRKSDGKWVASFIIEETGKRKYLYADPDNNTEKNAYKKLQDALFEQKQGRLATGPRQTVEQYLRSWFEDVHKPDLRETTYIQHRVLLDKHILPALGNIQLQKLTAQHVQHLYTDKIRDGWKPGSVRNIHKILRKALQNAVRWKLVSQNVCDDVTLPRDSSKHQSAHALTAEQALHLLKVSQGHSLEAFIALALATGIRHGEIMGLRWQDIDFGQKSMIVERTVSHIWGSGYIETEAKTEKSKREIMLPQFVVEALQKQQENVKTMRSNAGDKWEEKHLVFCTPIGTYLKPAYTLHLFHKLLAETGLPHIRIHDLRHSTASLLILALKMPPKLVQDLLGHSNVEMTLNIYTHADKSQQRQMMDTFDTFLKGN